MLPVLFYSEPAVVLIAATVVSLTCTFSTLLNND